MGLQIGYCYQASLTFDEATEIVRRLHRVALTLDLDEVTPLRTDTPGYAGYHYPIVTLPDGRDVTLDVPSLDAVWFSVYVHGSEDASFGLATRPPEVDGIPTGLDGRCSWQGGAKTQYAGMPQEGGPENFLRAHLGIVRLLDEAAALGLDVEVLDDGGYWEERDEDALLAELETWNRMIAGFGRFLTENVAPPVGPIFDHPDYERLSDEGLALLEKEAAQRLQYDELG